ncbi:MAG: 4a-hydroxytetrahydrobiopterin dehydratase [Candidatus Thalassarchaeaceae archaeon]|nr:4a-hydroxytetrahydrobiopterin dehydratase [Candidatus Thalassarchaeaceae archaeon]
MAATSTYGDELMDHHPNWTVVDSHHLERVWSFPDFSAALSFVNRVGAICESQNHHAEFELSWGKVLIRTWSHDIDGLSPRDWQLVKEIDAMM